MTIQEIKDSDYLVQYNPESATFNFKGILSLGGPSEYKPIANLLDDAAAATPSEITLDLRKLEFLNSSGISMLSKFVLGLRKNKDVQLIILGSNEMPWQGKSLKNLQKFLPSLKLEIE
jgi:hypothetical protein